MYDVITHTAHVNMVSTHISRARTALKLSDGYLRSGKLCPWPSRFWKYMEPHDRRAASLIGNPKDVYAVAVMCGATVVGHVPRKISAALFLLEIHVV